MDTQRAVAVAAAHRAPGTPSCLSAEAPSPSSRTRHFPAVITPPVPYPAVGGNPASALRALPRLGARRQPVAVAARADARLRTRSSARGADAGRCRLIGDLRQVSGRPT
jgi:hypothetical protein